MMECIGEKRWDETKYVRKYLLIEVEALKRVGGGEISDRERGERKEKSESEEEEVRSKYI